MGRVSIPLKKIVKNSTRQMTFCKRRKGLLKKAYELSILCDIDLALVIFSSTGRLSHFYGKKNIEDVFARYVNLDHPENSKIRLNRKHLINIIQRLKVEDQLAFEIASPKSSNSDALQQEIIDLQNQIHIVEQQLRIFEPEVPALKTMEKLDACEQNMSALLNLVISRKQYLMANQSSMNGQTSTQEITKSMEQMIFEPLPPDFFPDDPLAEFFS